MSALREIDGHFYWQPRVDEDFEAYCRNCRLAIIPPVDVCGVCGKRLKVDDE